MSEQCLSLESLAPDVSEQCLWLDGNLSLDMSGRCLSLGSIYSMTGRKFDFKHYFVFIFTYSMQNHFDETV